MLSRASFSISPLKHYVIASQSQRRLRGRPLYLSLGAEVIQLPGAPVINSTKGNWVSERNFLDEITSLPL